MTLTERDRRALFVLSVAAPVIILFFFGRPLLGLLLGASEEYEAQKASLAPTLEKIRNAPAWEAEAKKKMEALGVKVSQESADKQCEELIKSLEDLAPRNQVQIAQIRRVATKGAGKSAAAGVEKRSFQLECAAPYTSLIRFITDVQAAPAPVVIDEIALSPKKSKGGPPSLTAQLRFHAFIFPSIESDAKKLAASKPGGSTKPAAPAPKEPMRMEDRAGAEAGRPPEMPMGAPAPTPPSRMEERTPEATPLPPLPNGNEATVITLGGDNSSATPTPPSIQNTSPGYGYGQAAQPPQAQPRRRSRR